MTTMGGFDPIISRLERRLETIRQIKRMVAEDPSIASELISALGGTNGRVKHATVTRASVALDKIVGHFNSIDNRWATMAELLEATDLPKPGVASVLYRSHADHFEKRSAPGQRKTKQWRIKASAREEVHHDR